MKISENRLKEMINEEISLVIKEENWFSKFFTRSSKQNQPTDSDDESVAPQPNSERTKQGEVNNEQIKKVYQELIKLNRVEAKQLFDMYSGYMKGIRGTKDTGERSGDSSQNTPTPKPAPAPAPKPAPTPAPKPTPKPVPVTPKPAPAPAPKPPENPEQSEEPDYVNLLSPNK